MDRRGFLAAAGSALGVYGGFAGQADAGEDLALRSVLAEAVGTRKGVGMVAIVIEPEIVRFAAFGDSPMTAQDLAFISVWSK